MISTWHLLWIIPATAIVTLIVAAAAVAWWLDDGPPLKGE